MVAMVEPLLDELMEEAPATRKLLERVPGDKLDWRPHAKSRSIGELASHIAGAVGMAAIIANPDTFAPNLATLRDPVGSVEEIRAKFDENLRKSEDALKGMGEEQAAGTWGLVFGGKEIFRKPRMKALRANVLNHLYHHRGQLSVYLRLLEVSVPPVYGPTADENPFL